MIYFKYLWGFSGNLIDEIQFTRLRTTFDYDSNDSLKLAKAYIEIASTKINYNDKKDFIVNYLKKFGFVLKESFSIKSFSFLSNLKASDNLFINKNFKIQ